MSVPRTRRRDKRHGVFLDTGIFIAALDRSDRHHAAARELFGSPPKTWCTSLLVVSEAHSWFLHRLGEEPARRFQEFLALLPGFEILPADLDHHRAVLAMLDRLRGAKLTYVDASSLVFVHEMRISTVWSTDRHLGLTGAAIQPVA